MLTPSSAGPSHTAVAAALAVRNSPLATPQSKSCVAMSAAMALHFFGYEFARGSNVALFTSAALGFGSASGSHYPLAMAFVGPASAALFLAYAGQLDAGGPRRALRNTTLLCVAGLASSGAAASAMHRSAGGWAGARCLSSWTMAQSVAFVSFVFQNSYAQLLYAQQWSFLGSVCTPAQAGRYYGYIAGLSSVSSAIAGAGVSRVAGRTGLGGLLGIAAASLSCACALAEWAYKVYGRGGRENRRKPRKKNDDEQDTGQTSTSDSESRRRRRRRRRDYSLRNILAEMAYMPLSFDARFKGKEIVAVFANRFGKSGMALTLSGLHFSSGGRVGLSGMTLAATLAWLSSVVCLSNLIPSKVEAERLVAERNRSSDDNGESKKKQ